MESARSDFAHSSKLIEEKRLWIGNLDSRITEFQLLKLLQKHGEIEKFDLLFHRNGPLAGQPRGYAFVSYINRNDAITAQEVLHNKLLGAKRIIVKWAHNFTAEEPERPKCEINIPALAISKSENKTNRVCQIKAIEEKLKLMKHKGDEFEVNRTLATEPPVVQSYQAKKFDNLNCNKYTPRHKVSNTKKTEKRNTPYSKSRGRR